MSATRILKLLLCFKKPEIIHLSYINVLIKDKPVLFIAWEIENSLSVKLIPLRRRYAEGVNALILSMPKELNEVTVKAANFWRKAIVSLPVCTVELDEVATAQLISGFRPLSKLEVHAPYIAGIRSKAKVSSFNIKQRSTCIKNIDRFNINIQSFNYA